MNQVAETDSCAQQTASSQSCNSNVSERTRTQRLHVRNECTPIMFSIKPSGCAPTVSRKFISYTTLYIRSSTLTARHRPPHSPLLPSSAHRWNSLAAFLCHRTQPRNLSAVLPHETHRCRHPGDLDRKLWDIKTETDLLTNTLVVAKIIETPYKATAQKSQTQI